MLILKINFVNIIFKIHESCLSYIWSKANSEIIALEIYNKQITEKVLSKQSIFSRYSIYNLFLYFNYKPFDSNKMKNLFKK